MFKKLRYYYISAAGAVLIFCFGMFVGKGLPPDPAKMILKVHLQSGSIIDWERHSDEDVVFVARSYFVAKGREVLHGPSVEWSPILKSTKNIRYDQGKKVSQSYIDIFN